MITDLHTKLKSGQRCWSKFNTFDLFLAIYTKQKKETLHVNLILVFSRHIYHFAIFLLRLNKDMYCGFGITLAL